MFWILSNICSQYGLRKNLCKQHLLSNKFVSFLIVLMYWVKSMWNRVHSFWMWILKNGGLVHEVTLLLCQGSHPIWCKLLHYNHNNLIHWIRCHLYYCDYLFIFPKFISDISAALGLSLETMSKEELDGMKNAMHFILQGVSCNYHLLNCWVSW